MFYVIGAAMPGWILVANRFSLLLIIRSNGGLLSVLASLTCLVVVSGCSNMRQQSLDLPLPILPSEVATATQTADGRPIAPVLPPSDFAKDSSKQSDSALDHDSAKNDFVAGEFELNPSSQNSLPSENDFQPQQPLAKFAGELGKVEMTDIKLAASIEEAGPAPAIAKASFESDVENCESPEACNANGTAQCACCKKNELPKLTVVEPMDPEQMPELFGSNRTTTENKITSPVQLALQPLPAKNVDSAPIRLTARQDSEAIESQQHSENGTFAQTQNKAQMLIPIAPAELQASKAEVDQIKRQEAQTAAMPPAIKVSPIMDIESSTAKNLLAVPANAVSANEAVTSTVNAGTDQSKFIPVSSSGIQVSEVPFRSLPVLLPEPVVAPAEPIAEQKKPGDFVVTLAPITGPMPVPAPIEIVKAIEIVEPVESPKLVEDSQEEQKPSNDFSPSLTKPTESIEDFVVEQTTEVEAVQSENVQRANEFVFALPSEDINPLSDVEPSASVSPSANTNPVPGLSDLPDMSQIEKELAEFKKLNTFDPSTVIEADRMDPKVLIAKLDGPAKPIASPVRVIEVAAAPNNEIITQQLAAQSSALQELQDAIKQLKTKPVAAIPAAPKLTLNNAAFCTKISGFGQFKPFAANNFSGSQKTLLYCEVENQTSKQFTNFDGSQQFETVLHGSIVIYDANNQVVQSASFPAIKDVARHQRRDFYVYFPVQFDDLDRGDYRLELSIEDASASKTAVLQPYMRFSVR